MRMISSLTPSVPGSFPAAWFAYRAPPIPIHYSIFTIRSYVNN